MSRKTIFVSKLCKSADADELMELFGHYGLVHRATVWPEEPRLRQKTYGVVEMANEHEAKRAVRALDSHLWRGRKLHVSRSRSVLREHNG